MGDLKARIRAKFSRKNSAALSLASSTSSRAGSVRSSQQPPSIHQHENVDQSVRHGDHSAVSSVTDERRQSQRKGGRQREDDPSPTTTKHHKPGPENGVAGTLDRRSTLSSRDRTPLEKHQQDSTGSSSGVGGFVVVDGAATGEQLLTRIQSAGSDHSRASDASAMATSDQRLSTGKLSSINEHSVADQQASQHQHQHPQQQHPVTLAVAGTTLELVPNRDSTSEYELKYDPFLSPSVTTPTPRAGVVSLPISGASPTTVSLAGSSLGPSPSLSRPGLLPRRQSLFSNRQTTLIRTLLNGAEGDQSDPANTEQLIPINANMVTRKIWVKRPGASATLVTINEDDVVDDVREMILRKYANSLGRNFDAPDLTIRIKPREQLQERTLGPEEPMSRTLDAYFPGGQTVDEALIIDVPLRRTTPRASPRTGPPHAPHITSVYYADETRPSEAGNDYFGPSALSAAHIPVTVTAASGGSGHQHAISVLSTGQIPQIPSPGGTRNRPYRERPERPRLGRQHTSSPTIMSMVSGTHPGSIAAATANHGTQPMTSRGTRSRTHSNASSDQSNAAPVPPPLPTPPAPDATTIQRVATPPPRVASPRPTGTVRTKKSKKTAEPPTLPPGMLNGSVPPINVLIVEDNIINLKLLEAFVKRLKVRWQTAMNGREAVNKWRTGGFHLVLMDIQLPVMSGLDATREIRRLERVNSIGVFSSSASSAPEETNGETKEEDKLSNTDMFKSPVIIVALTASSLQSDRHEALAAGCNDFLTKPVSFVWLERKVMEWGCMQALIDFDGWRKWKDFSQKADEAEDAAKKKAAAAKAKTKKNRQSLSLTSA